MHWNKSKCFHWTHPSVLVYRSMVTSARDWNEQILQQFFHREKSSESESEPSLLNITAVNRPILMMSGKRKIKWYPNLLLAWAKDPAWMKHITIMNCCILHFIITYILFSEQQEVELNKVLQSWRHVVSSQKCFRQTADSTKLVGNSTSLYSSAWKGQSYAQRQHCCVLPFTIP